MGESNYLLSLICSYLIPPLGVYWRFGFHPQFFINVVLTLLGYLPGLIHACFLIGLES